MRSLRKLVRVARWFLAMARWRTGKLPDWWVRRLLIQALESNDAPSKSFEAAFGPALCQKVMDKARRRKMAVWKVKAMMTPVEKAEVLLRGVTRAFGKLRNAMEAK